MTGAAGAAGAAAAAVAVSVVPLPDGATLRVAEQLDGDDGDEDDVEDAVGRLIWPTARPLLEYLLLQQSSSSSSKTTRPVVLVELGAGCGVLGMGWAACRRAAANDCVVLTDRDEAWLRRNVALNPDMMNAANNKTRLQACALDWTRPADLVAVQDVLRGCLLLPVDRHDDADVWLVGSDVLYNHVTHAALAHVLHALATTAATASSSSSSSSRTTTRIVLGFPDRDRDDEAHFLRALRDEWPGRPWPRSSQPLLPHKPHVRVLDFWV